MKKAIGFKTLAVMLIFAFCIMAGGAWAETSTSTVDGAFYFDKTVITAGDRVNISILGLDSSGSVDKFGEQLGSSILGVVSSDKGTVKQTGSTPANAGAGSFAASVQYVDVTQGVGQTYVSYGADVSGTDTVNVTLQEEYTTDAGGKAYRVIKTLTQQVTVNAATAEVASLDIRSFAGPTADTRKIDDPNGDDGVQGTMTAGKAGGQFTVWAYGPGSTTSLQSANGTVSLIFSATDTGVAAYTYTGQMVKGEAIITLDDKITAAKTYYVEAQYGNLAAVTSSVPLIDPADKLTVLASTPVGFAISTDRTIIGAVNVAGVVAAQVRADMVDAFGNKATLDANQDAKLTFTPDTVTLAKQTITAGTTGVEFTINSKETLYDQGKTSGALTVIAGPDGTSSLLPSAAANLTVVSKLLTATSPGDATAGTGGAQFTVWYYNANGSQNTLDANTNVNVRHIKSTNFTSLEDTINATVTSGSANTGTIGGTFKKAATGTEGEFIIGLTDSSSYGHALVTGKAVTTGTFSSAKLKNAHGQELSVLPLTGLGNSKTTSVGGAYLYTYDALGNKISPHDIYAKVTSSNAAVSSSSTIAPQGNRGTLAGGGTITLTYDATKYPDGLTDTVSIAFTDPVNFISTTIKPTVTVPAPSSLNSLVMSISQTTIPLSGVVPVCVDALSASGKRIADSTVTMTITEATPALSQFALPTVRQLTAPATFGAIVSGQKVNLTAATTGADGRNVLEVTAPNTAGEFVITLKNATGTVTVSKTFTVQAQAVQAVDVGKEAGITEVTEPADALVNLYVNTTPQTGDTAVYEWFVFTATFADASAAKLPLYLLATDGTIVAIEDGVDIYDYTFDYGTSSVQLIAELTMADLGLTTGDVFAYGYAYQNELGDIYLPNVVFITVE